jgi:hypothetical protein
MVVGELVGFVPPALAGAALATVGVADAVFVLGLTIAGALEGVVIGVAQAWVLARYASDVSGRRWVVATAAAASFAWFVGMAGSSVLGSGIAPVGFLLAVLLPMWGAALVSMGYLQWRVLRVTVPRSGRWVVVTSGAWLIGVMIPVAALSAVPNGWPMWAHAGAAVLGAAGMGATVGLLTGHTLKRLLEGRPGR